MARVTSEATIPTCYRHPDRETRLGCSNCGRPVCVDCVRTAAVGQRCLECASPSERQRVMDMDDVRRATVRSTPVTYAILGAAVLVFVAGFLGQQVDQTISLYLAQINPLVAQGEWWRTVTAAFVHGGLYHVGFNMYALYLFGPQLEREVGSVPFAIMYVACAIAGGAAYFLASPQGVAVGASGAVFGLFGAWLVASFRGRATVAGRANLQSMLFLLGINLAIGFLPGLRIAWQAHVGGLIAGALIAFLWSLPPLRNQPVLRAAAAAAVGALALLIII